MVWFSLAFCLEFVLRILWVCDKKTVISGGDGVELWPRKLATAKFLIEDMKTVKRAVANATINDVLFGVISSGLSRYLNQRSPKALQEGQQITGMAMVNLREKQAGSIRNVEKQFRIAITMGQPVWFHSPSYILS
ncbi:hypothetical protein OIU77_001157 [Salix suchowensis]|uniref:Diacylglycerol O-acyltransferase n=1 Tax=Salix suchowensis TaxID=1278906 RepID=A0ABQ8ZGJ3_9ROSI|nr:hypothetical protein OIU77_001157 [Salix suchowensis]